MSERSHQHSAPPDAHRNDDAKAPAKIVPDVPITPRRIEECYKSAHRWVRELPRYARREKSKGNWWAIGSGVSAAVTGLAVWPVLTADESIGATVVVSAVAFFASLCTVIPKVQRYTENAEVAQQLASEYSDVYGRLTDLFESKANLNQAKAKSVLEDFRKVKTKKDKLDRLPSHRAIERNDARDGFPPIIDSAPV